MSRLASGGPVHRAQDEQRVREALVIQERCPGYVVLWGRWSRLLWAFGAPDGEPVGARTASELLGRIRAVERRSDEGPADGFRLPARAAAGASR